MNKNRLIFLSLIVTLLLVGSIAIYSYSKNKVGTGKTSNNSSTKEAHKDTGEQIANLESQDEKNRQTSEEIATKIGNRSGTNWSLKYETEGSLKGYFRISIDAKGDIEVFNKAREESFAVFRNAGYDPCGEDLKGTISVEPTNMPLDSNSTSYNPC